MAYHQSVYDTPDPRGLTRPRSNGQAGAGRRWRALLSSRTRIHPVLLLPVFLFGALFAPFLSTHLLSPLDRTTRLPEPVYHPEDYAWKPTDVFAEPDAPPLVAEDDGAASKRKKEQDRVLARDGHGDGADEWEWWDPSSSSPSSPQLSGADLTASIYTVHRGLLYFSSSPSSIPPISPDPHFPTADSKRLSPALPRPKMPDEGLTLPPPPPISWLAPGELFVHPPGQRVHALDRRALAGLHDPLPPVARNPPPAPPRAPAAALNNRRNAAAERKARAARPELDKNGHRLGPNAAAMARAKREGTPFSPKKPQELIEEEETRKQKQKIEDARKKAEGMKGQLWAVAPEGGEKKKAAVAHFLDEEEEDEEENDEEEEESWGDDDELLDLEGEDEDESPSIPAISTSSDDDDEELDIDPSDDAALLAAIRQLSPSELKELSPAERELVVELEAAEKAAKAAGGRKAKRSRPESRAGEAQGNGRVRPPPGRLLKRSFDATEEESVPAVLADVEDTASPAATDASSPPPPAKLHKRALAADLDLSSGSPSSSDSTSSSARPRPSDRLHPIAHLISRAEEEWDDMLRRQSQTLEQAVEEYVRRYGMRPPAGFDAWWRYAMENRVILVDEYDQINSDLLPFHSLPVSEFRRRASALQTDSHLPWFAHSFVLSIKDGEVAQMPGSAGKGGSRTEDLMDLLGEFSELLPDMQLRFSDGDEPAVAISGEARERHVQYAKEGKVLGLTPSYEILEPTGFTAWDALCPPNSTARRTALALPVDTPRGVNLQSFVSIEHAQTMDLCEHPDLRAIHGFTASWTGPRPYLLYPLFSFSKTSVHADILVPLLSNDYYVEVGRDPTWEAKKHNKVLWRGDTTGSYHARGTGWRQGQRARLVALANPSSGTTSLHLASRSSDDALRRTSAPSADVASHYLDIAYQGNPVQCSTKDKTCALLSHEFRFEKKGKVLTPDEENGYKYVLDVDANYPSGKFKRLMSSRSLVMKSTIFPEWWTKRIMPWYHYVPIKSDYSDLLDVSAFFIGGPDGSNAHDLLAKRIGLQGKKWADEHFREADIAAYLFRLYLEYARLLNRDEDNPHTMDYSA